MYRKTFKLCAIHFVGVIIIINSFLIRIDWIVIVLLCDPFRKLLSIDANLLEFLLLKRGVSLS